jgi:adenine-specific DNA glycosylase
MDLGATNCTARAPGCSACPARPICRSRERYAPK